ncbi:hypothetical protein ACYOEI_26505 [Singulisphaera rosea]
MDQDILENQEVQVDFGLVWVVGVVVGVGVGVGVVGMLFARTVVIV